MERLEWKPTPEEIEKAPSINFICALGRFALRPWNSAQYTFIRRFNQFDHIFTWKTEYDDWPLTESEGFYIPRFYLPGKEYREVYDTMTQYMFDNDYPAHINMDTVSSTDYRIISSMLLGDLSTNDSFPEDWV